MTTMLFFKRPYPISPVFYFDFELFWNYLGILYTVCLLSVWQGLFLSVCVFIYCSCYQKLWIIKMNILNWKWNRNSPVFGLCSTVSLTPVFEPVGHLRGRQASRLRQLSLLSRRRVRVVGVPVSQHGSRLLLETVRSFLSVPDCARQREFTSDAVFPDRAERSSAQLFGLDVVAFQPKRLEFRVIMRRKVVRLQQSVEFFEVAAMKRHDCLRLEHALVLVQVLAGRQRPQKSGEAFHIAGVLQNFADACHLQTRPDTCVQKQWKTI